MKTTRIIFPALLAAGSPSVALLALSGLVPADLALAGITALGLVAFAIDDFSRNTASMRVRAEVVRPPLHAADRPVAVALRKAA